MPVGDLPAWKQMIEPVIRLSLFSALHKKLSWNHPAVNFQ